MDLSLPSLFLFFAQIAPCSIAVDRPCWAAGFRGEVGERREHPGERRTTLAIVINCPREREEKEEFWRDREPQPKLGCSNRFREVIPWDLRRGLVRCEGEDKLFFLARTRQGAAGRLWQNVCFVEVGTFAESTTTPFTEYLN